MSGLPGRSHHALGLRVGRRQRERTRAARLASAPLAQASSERSFGAHDATNAIRRSSEASCQSREASALTWNGLGSWLASRRSRTSAS